MEKVEIRVTRLPGCEDLELPGYATPGAAGMDVSAAVPGETVIAPGDIKYIPAGIRIALPPGYEAQLRPRSGLALKKGLGIVNSPGTIDSDYRGEVGVIAVNHGRLPITVFRGMRMAQLVIQRVIKAQWRETGELGETDRGAGGFGSSGQ